MFRKIKSVISYIAPGVVGSAWSDRGVDGQAHAFWSRNYRHLYERKYVYLVPGASVAVRLAVVMALWLQVDL